MILIDRGAHHLRVGKLVVDWRAAQAIESPIVDGCSIVLTTVGDGLSHNERFGGVCISGHLRKEGVAVGWLGAPAGGLPWYFRPHSLRRLVWTTMGWGTGALTMTTGGCSARPSPAAEEAGRIAAVTELRRIAREIS